MRYTVKQSPAIFCCVLTLSRFLMYWLVTQHLELYGSFPVFSVSGEPQQGQKQRENWALIKKIEMIYCHKKMLRMYCHVSINYFCSFWCKCRSLCREDSSASASLLHVRLVRHPSLLSTFYLFLDVWKVSLQAVGTNALWTRFYDFRSQCH